MKHDIGRSHLLRWLERAEADHASMRPAHEGWACCDCAIAMAIKGRLRAIVTDAVVPHGRKPATQRRRKGWTSTDARCLKLGRGRKR